MIFEFKTDDVPSLSQVGGKGKALIETTNAGFPVPKGIVLSVDFFDEWLKEIKSSEAWNSLIVDTTKENCDVVKTDAAKLIFTDNQRKAFKEHIKKLQGDVFAVRSSSPEEDLEGTSFAGMYETILGVLHFEIEKMVAHAFSSCFDFRVMAYKKQNNISLEGTRIAIIVQNQIASDVSGVGFSLNPINNAYDEVFINASFGLGEAIVSGIVTPDTYIVNSIKGEIIEKKVSNKKIALYLKSDGGIEEKNNDKPELQALSDNQIIELSLLIKKCELHYNKPMDTEWAYEKGELYLLQSRPITAYIPLFPELLTAPGEKKNIYMDVMEMTQGFTESMSVLGLELWTNMLEEIKGAIMSCGIDGTSPAVHGRQYINFSYFRKAFGKGLADKMIGNYDGNVKKIFSELDLDGEFTPLKTPVSLKGKKGELITMVLPMLPSMIKAYFSDYKKVVSEYNEMSNRIIEKSKKIKAEDSFDVTVSKMLKEVTTIMNTAGILLVGMSSFASIRKLFKGHDIETEVSALGMDLDGNPTSAMGHLMYKMACYNEFKETSSREEFLNKIDNKKYSIEFLSDYNEFIEKYGVRGFKEIDVASTRAYEDPGSGLDRLKEINIKDNQITQVKEKRELAYQKLLAVAKKEGFEKKFIKLASKYQGTMGYREHPKYVIVYIYAMMHNVCIEIGKKWANAGRLEDKMQIFDLHADEISKAQEDENLDLMALREKNIAPYKVVSQVTQWPLVIDSRGKIYRPKLEIKDGDITGDPIAPGIVRGKAKVLLTPYEKPLLPGEILVTTATEPSWTPIFINAAGVVLEIGGPLQHGGIIAREYGIPCVSGLLGIMDIIKDGDLIEVDGSNGIVRIIG